VEEVSARLDALSTEDLSLCFKHGGFAMGIKPIAKPPFSSSSGLRRSS
jgi:hypothetical protein